MLKTLNKLGIEGDFFQVHKDYPPKKNPTANVFNREKVQGFPLKSGTRQGCPLYYSFTAL